MANGSIDIQTTSAPIYAGSDMSGWTIVWCLGMATSCACGLLQCVMLAVFAKCRKYDEIIITQLTLARILNTATEFWIMNGHLSSVLESDIVFTLFFHMDFVLVCFMYLFSKNLYNKVVLVFSNPPKNIAIVSALVWVICFLLALICPFILHTYNETYFFIYWRIFFGIKFIILLINAGIFVCIFFVAFKRGTDIARTARESLKVAVVSFLLVFVTSMQVFITELLAYLYESDESLAYAIGVFNSFQAVPVTVIFTILAKSKINHSMRAILIRLKDVKA